MSDVNKINILGKHQIYLASKYAKIVQCVMPVSVFLFFINNVSPHESLSCFYRFTCVNYIKTKFYQKIVWKLFSSILI